MDGLGGRFKGDFYPIILVSSEHVSHIQGDHLVPEPSRAGGVVPRGRFSLGASTIAVPPYPLARMLIPRQDCLAADQRSGPERGLMVMRDLRAVPAGLRGIGGSLLGYI